MHKRRIFIIIAVLAALILTGGSSYYLGTKSQQSRPETAVAEVVEPGESLATSETRTISANILFVLVNDERAKANLAPLARDARLDASAQSKCMDIYSRNYWSHEDPDGRMPWHLFSENGYPYYSAGENIAKDYTIATSMVRGWMKSEDHRKNILNAEFSDTGIAVCGENNIAVQHFANK